MSFFGFINVSAGWLAALFVPLVLLYFLKLKRPVRQMPSLAMWQQVMNDQRVNSPFQRFKRNLLLLLQCLILACLVLAAMQPYWGTGASRAKYLPILIDCSASMGALDKTGGNSRLEVAKAEVRKIIDNLLGDQLISLITMNSTGRRLTDFTNNKKLLHTALDHVTISDVPSRLDDALRLTQALARTYSIERALVITDGNIPLAVDLELPFQIVLQTVPPAGANIGITELNARRSNEAWEVFARLEASQNGGGTVTAEFFQDGELLGTEQVSLEAREAQRLVFKATSHHDSRIEVRLKPLGYDSLGSDNIGWLELPILRPLRVFVSPELNAYRKALEKVPGLEIHPILESDRPERVNGYDLVISHEESETVPPAPVALFDGVTPQEVSKLVKVETSLVKVVDWQRNAPLLQHVQLSEVQMSDNPVRQGEASDRDFEQLGYEILAHASKGPLILQREREGRQDFWLLFQSDHSTLTYRIGFPILVNNLIQIALRQAGLSEIRGQSTGVLPSRLVDPSTTYTVVAPDGKRQEITSSSEGLLLGVAASRVGKYEIQKGLSPILKTSASLLNSAETSLNRTETIQFREVEVLADATKVNTDQPLWWHLSVLGLITLGAEWWYFQRKPGGW